MVTTTSAHIPKKRLIELLDMEHGDGSEGYDIREMQDRVVNKLDRTVPEPEPVHTEPRPVGRLSRKDLEFGERTDYEQGTSGYSDTKYSSTISSLTINPIEPKSDPTPIYAEQSSTDDYTSNSDNLTSQSDSAEAESPIDIAMDNPQTLSTQSSVFEDCVFEDVEEFKRNLPVEDRESLLALENLTHESSSFSDNEKTLLEQMKKMQEDHQSTILSYEDRLDELVKKLNEMRNMAEQIKEHQTTKATAESGTKAG